MKRMALVLYIWLIIDCQTAPAFAYEINTHDKLSEAAATVSSLVTDSTVVQNLGIKNGDKFPNSNNEPKSIVELIRDGAKFEDDFPRSLNHFFNPLNGSGLTFGIVTGLPSPDWALEDHGDVNGQEFSYKHARQYFFDALTKPVKAERDRNFGLTFQTLGQVIHHLQDMAQPQHVRNDPHCDAIIPCLIPGGLAGLHNPSLYEKYTDDVRNNLPFGGYAPVYDDSNTSIFTIPRKLWRTSPEGQSDISQGMGIAEYTNRNFVSAGTNFDKPGLFPSPVFDPATKQEVDIKTLIPGTGLSGIVTFYGNIVQDTLRPGETRANPRASTESIFDADLKKASRQPIFSLNRFNFDQAHKFLIPRAVGYSAGLINYFFRGQIDFLPDPDHFSLFMIKNLGTETVNGELALYYDDQNGNRIPVKGGKWAGEILPGGKMDQLVFDTALGNSDPEPKTSGEYMLVFKGDMGEEKAATNGVGAVTGKLVHDPLLLHIQEYVYQKTDGTTQFGLTLYFDPISLGPALSQATATDITLKINSHTTSCMYDSDFKVLSCQPIPEAGLLSRSLEFHPQGHYLLNDARGVMFLVFPESSGTVTLLYKDKVVYSFSFSPATGVRCDTVSFSRSLRFDAKGAKKNPLFCP